MYTLQELYELIHVSNPTVTLEQVVTAAQSVTRRTGKDSPTSNNQVRVTHKGAEAIATALSVTL